MVTGINAPDGGFLGCMTDGSDNLIAATILATNIPKHGNVRYAPDGSMYMALTDGVGTLLTTA